MSEVYIVESNVSIPCFLYFWGVETFFNIIGKSFEFPTIYKTLRAGSTLV